MNLTSTTFTDGATMPMSTVFSGMGCTGGNRSPQLAWSGAPAGTKSFAITLWDPDAPTTVGFCHWIAYDIPADTTSLDEGAGGKHILPGAPFHHGHSDFGQNAYGGPCPPPGDPPHHYHFTLYALDLESIAGAAPGMTYANFRFQVREHTLATAELLGRWGH